MKDIHADYSTEVKHQNLRQLRRFLEMTQTEFLDAFFQDGEGKRQLSVAKLSNIESRGSPQLDAMIVHLSAELGLDPMSFSLPPEDFYDQLKESLSGRRTVKEGLETGERKGNIAKLVNRLTMYFADQLLTGKLHRGEQIASDRTLAQEMDVGRSAIREALKVLDVMGMIDIRPGDGTYISSRESDFFIIPLSWSLFMNGNQIDSILEMRDMVEVRAAQLAARCRDLPRTRRLNEVFQEMQRAYELRDTKAFLDMDVEFHMEIAECSCNQILSSLIRTIRNLLKWASESGMSTEEHVRVIYEEHQRIHDRIVAGDPQGAGQAMHDHLERSRRRYQL